MPEEKTTNPRAAAQLSGRVTQETLAKFKEIQEAESFETFGQFVESLLMHYYDPVKVNKENEAKIAELQRKVEELTSKIKEKEDDNNAACETVNEERAKYEELRSEYNQAMARIEQLEREKSLLAETANDYDTLKKEIDGCISVPVTPLHLKCLKYLAERENRTRKRNDITPATFYQFAIDEIFIKGNKFSIPSIEDRIIRKFEAEIANGQ